MVSNLKQVGIKEHMSLIRREGNWVSSNLSGFPSEGTSSYQQHIMNGKIDPKHKVLVLLAEEIEV